MADTGGISKRISKWMVGPSRRILKRTRRIRLRILGITTRMLRGTRGICDEDAAGDQGNSRKDGYPDYPDYPDCPDYPDYPDDPDYRVTPLPGVETND